VRALDLAKDVLQFGRPDEWLRVIVPGDEDLFDRLYKVWHAVEDAASLRLLSQLPKPLVGMQCATKR